MTPQFLTVRDLSELLKVHRSTLHRWVKRGEFPPPLKFGAAARWREQDIADWAERQSAAPDGGPDLHAV